jgi:hypothetical protein
MNLFGLQSSLEDHEYPQDFRTNTVPGQMGEQMVGSADLSIKSKVSKGIIVRALVSLQPLGKSFLNKPCGWFAKNFLVFSLFE